MAVSDHYLNKVLERLSQVAPVSYRRIFAGVGLYHRGVQFALLANDRLYFRVDDISVQPYLDSGMPALHPEAALTTQSHFYQLPPGLLDRPEELLYWMRAAVEAAQPAQAPNTPLEASTSPTTRRSLAG